MIQAKKRKVGKNGLPEGWIKGKLRDFADVQTGPFGSQLHKKDYVEEGTPIITVEHLGDNRIVSTNTPFVSEADKIRLSKYSMQTGDIIFSRVGSVDRRALVSELEDGWLFSGRCLRVRVENKSLDSQYLSYFFGNESVKEHIRKIAVGATMPSLNTKILSDIEIILPPLAEQKEIAHILGTLDDKIECNRKMNRTLEAMAEALFKSWFVDFEPVIDNAILAGNPIPEPFAARAAKRRAYLKQHPESARTPEGQEVRALFPDRFVEVEEFGWVPEGWGVKALDEIVEINPRLSLQKGTSASYIDMKALPTSGYSIERIIKKVYSGGVKFQNNDVLLARITPCLENGKTAIVDCLDDKEIGFGSTEFIVLRGYGAVQMPFVACVARNSKFREHCIQSMVGSSGRQRVHNSCFSNYYIALPRENELLLNFNRKVEKIFTKISNHTQQSITLKKVRDILLSELFSGDIKSSGV